MDLKIIEDYIKAIEASNFQDFCDRLLHNLYPDEFIDVRAGGRNGDMKNDGYCYLSRIFFQAHATRGESAKKTKDKISNDFYGCINKWKYVDQFVYITNDSLIGEVENFIDDLRHDNPNVRIITWTPKKILNLISNLKPESIEYIIDRKLSYNQDSVITNIRKEQFRKDSQTALLYQTEIKYFFAKFKTCLHWSLPLGKNINKELDEIFNYGANYSKEICFNKMTKEIISNIFVYNEFRSIMPNYSSRQNFKPTGFNNILGILNYFYTQVETHLNKYASSTSYELTSRIEYNQKMVVNTIRAIRLDLNSFSSTKKQTADNIAELLILMRDELNTLKINYFKEDEIDYPLIIGTVTKSDSINGSIVIETQFSPY